MTEQILQEVVSNGMKYSRSSESCQPGLMKMKLCLTKRMSFHEMNGLVDEGADVVYIKIKKAFDTVSQDSFKDQLMTSGLKKWIERWTENWLNDRAQKTNLWQSPATGQSVVVNTIKTSH